MPLVDTYADVYSLLYGEDDGAGDVGIPAVSVATVGGGPVSVASVGFVVSVASMGG